MVSIPMVRAAQRAETTPPGFGRVVEEFKDHVRSRGEGLRPSLVRANVLTRRNDQQEPPARHDGPQGLHRSAGQAVKRRLSDIKAEYADVKQGYTALYDTAKDRAVAAATVAAKPVGEAVKAAFPDPIKARFNNVKEEYRSLREGYAELFDKAKKNDFWQTGVELGAAGLSHASGVAEGLPANVLDGTSNELWRASVPGTSSAVQGEDAAARLGRKADAATGSATSYGRIKVAANLADIAPLAAFGNTAYSVNWGKNAVYSVQKSWGEMKDHFRQGSPLVIADTLNLTGGALNGVAAGLSAVSPIVPATGLWSSGAWIAGAGCGVAAKTVEKLAPRIERLVENRSQAAIEASRNTASN